MGNSRVSRIPRRLLVAISSQNLADLHPPVAGFPYLHFLLSSMISTVPILPVYYTCTQCLWLFIVLIHDLVF